MRSKGVPPQPGKNRSELARKGLACVEWIVERTDALRKRIVQFAACTFVLVAVAVVADAAEDEALPPRNEATFEAIRAAALEPNRDVRMRAAWALGAMRRKDAVPTLVKLAADPVPEVRAAAFVALCRVLPAGSDVAASVEVPVGDPTLARAALYAASRLKFKGRDRLIAFTLEGTGVSGKVLAVKALGLDAPQKARPLVKKALADGHALVRAEAVRVLGKGKDPEAAAAVLAAMKDTADADAFAVRAAACEALVAMKPSGGVPALTRAVGDEHFAVRRAAVRGLRDLKARSALRVIRNRLDDKDYTVRVAACEALAAIVDPSSAVALARALADDVVEVRAAAEAALVKHPADAGHKALLPFVDYMKRLDTRIRVWRLLGEYAHPGSRETAFKHLEDRHSDVSGYAMRVLRKLGDRRLIPFLKRVLKEPGKNSAGPGELQAQEGFRAAALFKARDYIGFARLCISRTLNPPMAEDIFIPTEGMAIAGALYLADIGDRGSAGLIEGLVKLPQTGENAETAAALVAAVKKLTGKTVTPPPPRKPTKIHGTFFIEVKGE